MDLQQNNQIISQQFMWHHQRAITIFYNKDKMQHSFNVLFEITKSSDHKFIKNINLDNRNHVDTEN